MSGCRVVGKVGMIRRGYFVERDKGCRHAERDKGCGHGGWGHMGDRVAGKVGMIRRSCLVGVGVWILERRACLLGSCRDYLGAQRHNYGVLLLKGLFCPKLQEKVCSACSLRLSGRIVCALSRAIYLGNVEVYIGSCCQSGQNSWREFFL
jgi:hypothetical protein